MIKKGLGILVSAIIIGIIILSSVANKSSGSGGQTEVSDKDKVINISIEDVQSLEIKALSVEGGPKTKEVNKKEDIEFIINYLNNIDAKEIKDPKLKGVSIWIYINESDYYNFLQHTMYHNKKAYAIDEQVLTDLQSIYDKLNE